MLEYDFFASKWQDLPTFVAQQKIIRQISALTADHTEVILLP